jgi:hypothetical protein
MSLGGKWLIVEMPDFEADYPNMVEQAYILFDDNSGGEFAFGCCTGHIWAASSTEAQCIDFSWDGSDEMDEVNGDGFAELQPDGSLKGQICYQNGDDCNFVAKRVTSSTAC